MPPDSTLHAEAAPSLSPSAAGCRAVLHRRLAAAPGVRAAVMATVDGRAFAHAQADGQDLDAARAGAIASSLLALAEAFSRETLRGHVQYNSIATDRGTIVVVRVPSRARTYALSVWADRSELFAVTLRFALDTAAQLAATIDAPAAAPVPAPA